MPCPEFSSCFRLSLNHDYAFSLLHSGKVSPWLQTVLSSPIVSVYPPSLVQMCDVLQLSPCPLPVFYPRLKVKLRSWRAASLWTKLDKRAAHKCYNRGKACAGMRVSLFGRAGE